MSVAPLLVGYTQALSSIQPMSSQNVQNPSTSNHKELLGLLHRNPNRLRSGTIRLPEAGLQRRFGFRVHCYIVL